jgi:nucleoside-diphosphate-sugar epimerase
MKVIITGATGMVGKSVLLECLDHKKVEKILVINRKPLKMKHPKVVELVVSDFNNITQYQDSLRDYDACFFCMGISSIGLNESTYTGVTYGITKAFADTLFKLNKKMVFNYVSGTNTDSSEKGNSMWARVKGKTENYILNKGFKDAYMFRPGAIVSEKGIKSNTVWYNVLYVLARPFFPLMKKSKNITTTTKLGVAMINTVLKPTDLKHLENVDINRYAKL